MMLPFWESECGRYAVYCGDCRDILPTFKDNHFDAIITDPPFGIGNFVQTSGNVRGSAVTWNFDKPEPKVFEQLRRISKHRIIWGANYFNCFEGAGSLVWVKNQPMPNFSQAEVASVSWGSKVSVFTHTWTNYVNSKVTDHPCERPVPLYLWCLTRLPEWPRSVFDPYMGSGSVGVACIRSGVPFVGIESNLDYCKAAVKRIKDELSRPALPFEDSVGAGQRPTLSAEYAS